MTRALLARSAPQPGPFARWYVDDLGRVERVTLVRGGRFLASDGTELVRVRRPAGPAAPDPVEAVVDNLTRIRCKLVALRARLELGDRTLAAQGLTWRAWKAVEYLERTDRELAHGHRTLAHRRKA